MTKRNGVFLVSLCSVVLNCGGAVFQPVSVEPMVNQPIVSWIGASGDWKTPANWSTGVIPVPNDDVVIDVVLNSLTIVHSSGTSTIRSLQCTETLNLSGGSITVTSGASQVSGALTIAASSSLTANGANVVLTVSGTVAADGASLNARNGATLSLPGLRTYQAAAGCAGATWQANGAGSVLDLPGLTNLVGGFCSGLAPLNMQALAGGQVLLTNVTTIPDSTVSVLAEGANSVVALPELADFQGSKYPLSLETRGGGNILVPQLAHASQMNLHASGGAILSLLALRSYQNAAGCADATWQASGAGSVLDLSGLTNVVGGTCGTLNVQALSDGQVILTNVTSMANGKVSVLADGANSVVDFSGLSSRTNRDSFSLEARNGGQILIPNRPPVISSIPDQRVSEGIAFSLIIAATDPDTPAQGLNYSLDETAPPGANIDPVTGTLTWTPTEAQGPSTNVFAVKVTDKGVPPLSDTRSVIVVVNEVNSPPAIVPLSDKVVEERTKVEFKIEATDSDFPRNGLTFSLAADAPAGAAIDAATGVFSWVTGEASVVQTNSVTVRVVDDGSPPMAATNTFLVVTTPSKLRLEIIQDRSVDEEKPLTFIAATTSSPLAQLPLTYSLEPGSPIGATISPATGAFFWLPTEAQGPSTNTLIVRVADSSSPPLIARQSFTVVVTEVNRPPVLDSIARQTNVVGRTLIVQLSATDEDLPANQLTYSLEPGAPAEARIDPTTGLFRWTPGPASASSTNSISVRVSDNGTPELSDVKRLVVVLTPPGELYLSALILAPGQFQLTLSTEPGRTYFIETTINLRNWELVTNLVSTTTSVQIIDPALLEVRQRFYRAVSP
jgi:hypothetical protein